MRAFFPRHVVHHEYAQRVSPSNGNKSNSSVAEDKWGVSLIEDFQYKGLTSMERRSSGFFPIVHTDGHLLLLQAGVPIQLPHCTHSNHFGAQ